MHRLSFSSPWKDRDNCIRHFLYFVLIKKQEGKKKDRQSERFTRDHQSDQLKRYRLEEKQGSSAMTEKTVS
jgi:hypothetical protein